MNMYDARQVPLARMLMMEGTLLLILSVLLWTIGAPSFLRFAHAAQVISFSDTLSNSNLSATAVHVIQFTSTAAVNPNATLVYHLDPTTSLFTEAYSTATSTHITMDVGGSPYTLVNSCTSGDQFQATGNYNNGSDEKLTLTLCPSATPIATTTVLTLSVGTTSEEVWTNPGTQNSYIIRLDGSSTNSGDTRVAILPNVTVTASVDTSFTFTVTGLATSSALYADSGITTTGSSTATTLPFGLLTPGASSTLGQTLSVTTNARNGFVVTVQENQPLTDSAGAIINLFKNGSTTTSPTAWTSPTNVLDQSNTYSHFGLTSDDQDEGSGEFVGGGYVGNFDQPRAVFSHNGPADGTTQNKGKADVFYTAQVGTLQPAGNDYTNILTYVATPTF